MAASGSYDDPGLALRLSNTKSTPTHAKRDEDDPVALDPLVVDDALELVRDVCDAPLAGLSLLGPDGQWFAATAGFEVQPGPQSAALCRMAVEGNDLLVVPDARAWAESTGADLPPVGFYAGMPLVTRDGRVAGVLFAADLVPRHLGDGAATRLRALARQVVAQLDLVEAGQEAARLARRQAETAALAEAALGMTELQDVLDEAVRAVMTALSPEACWITESLHSAGIIVRAASGSAAPYRGRVVPDHAQIGLPHRPSPHVVRIRRGTIDFGALVVRPNPLRPLDAEDEDFVASVARPVLIAAGRVSYEATIRRQAMTDPLTGLANRDLFCDHVAGALTRLKRTGSGLAILFADVDRFKIVNDSLGHGAGDQLLRVVAQRLQETVRPQDTVARFGGDEFVVLAEEITRRDAALLASRLARAVSRPAQVDDRTYVPHVSIGYTVSDDARADADELIAEADVAMYRAKDRGGGQPVGYTTGMREHVRRRLDLEQALREAIRGEGLRLHFQPIVDIRDGGVTGAEALLRWPARASVSPQEMVAMAEETGLIGPLGGWIVRTACEQLRAWQAAGLSLHLSVNVSATQLRLPSLSEEVARIIGETGVEASHLTLEVTETALIGMQDDAVNALRALRSMGLQVAIDDFGTGYSSLAQLTHLPVDALKVDRLFVERLEDPTRPGQRAAAVLATVCQLARALGLTSVAEGVETSGQLDRLRAVGCDRAQGFLFGVPVAGEEVADLLRAG